MEEIIDRTPGQVNKLNNSLDRLTHAITAQGIGVIEKVDVAAARIKDAVNEASNASSRHANNLVRATRTLVFATVALVFVSAMQAFVAASPLLFPQAAATNTAYTLYRSSAITENMRVHVATFDADDRAEYNANNCEIAETLFAAQPGVTTRFWCERGTYRK